MCLLVEIPAPSDEKLFLGILERGNFIQVSLGDEKPPNIAEKIFISEEGEHGCITAALDFVNDILEERVVIAKQMSWTSFFLTDPTSFVDTDDLNQKRYSSVASWKGTHTFLA